MSPIDLGTAIARVGLVVGVVGLGWTIVAFVRHRGALGAQRAVFVGLGIMTAAMPISLLAIPDRPTVISALALCLFLIPVLPVRHSGQAARSGSQGGQALTGPAEILLVAAAALWILLVISSYFAVRFSERNTALLRLLADKPRPGKPGVAELLVVIPLAACVCVLQGVLLIGTITLEPPISRLVAGIEVAAAVGWIVYLVSRPRAIGPEGSDGPV